MAEDYTYEDNIEEEEYITSRLKGEKRERVAKEAAKQMVKKEAKVVAKKVAGSWVARGFLAFVAADLPIIIGVLLVIFIVVIILDSLDIFGWFSDWWTIDTKDQEKMNELLFKNQNLST